MTARSATRIILNKKEKSDSFDLIGPAYKPWPIIIRVLFNSFVAVFMVQFMSSIINESMDFIEVRKPGLWDYLRVIIYFNFLGEALILVDMILELFLPVPGKIRLRVFIQTVITVFLVFVVLIIIKRIEHWNPNYPRSVFYLANILGLIFVMLLSSSLLLIRLTSKWIRSQQQIDEMKKEKLQMDYNSLQDQLNPHFLFNNLSVLKSLIIYDKDGAVKFTENFTDVYRYVLQSKDKKTVNFEEELEFIQSYIGLHQERLGEGINIKYSIDDKSKNKKIAPLTLQLLVENAIKHNITSKKSPLLINIEATENQVTVLNNLQLKESSYSTNTGLRNLVKRYSFLTDTNIEITETQDKFRVVIPLI